MTARVDWDSVSGKVGHPAYICDYVVIVVILKNNIIIVLLAI